MLSGASRGATGGATTASRKGEGDPGMLGGEGGAWL